MKNFVALLFLLAGPASAWNPAIPFTATGTAAAGSAVTVTIPAGGANTYSLITRIEVTMYATAAITASATPLRVTTTNMSNMSFVFANVAAAAAAVQQKPNDASFSPGVMSLTPNTAVTIVCPATANVIWNVCVWYTNVPMPVTW